MEITRKDQGDILELLITGRLDAYWASHLEQEISAVIREGRRRIVLNLADLSYISSAGIRVLLKFRKQLQTLDGMLSVASPSAPVMEIIKLMKLGALLAPSAPSAAPKPTGAAEKKQTLEVPDGSLDIHPQEANASLTCRAVGNPDALRRGGYAEEDCRALTFPAGAFALGVGALGGGFADCRARFGEFIAVGGAVAYQPTDRGNVPDYLIATGGTVSGLQALHGLVCEGRFSHVVSFEAKPDANVSLRNLTAHLLTIVNSDALGVVMAVEVAGLVGSALKRSPALVEGGATPFSHPEIRSWLRFTTEPVYARGVAIIVGVASRKDNEALRPMVRPLGEDEWPKGHFHAAAFTYRPLKKGDVDLAGTVRTLFEGEMLNGILHLLSDHRPIAGAGQSEFVRGTCWIAPISKVVAERE